MKVYLLNEDTPRGTGQSGVITVAAYSTMEKALDAARRLDDQKARLFTQYPHMALIIGPGTYILEMELDQDPGLLRDTNT